MLGTICLLLGASLSSAKKSRLDPVSYAHPPESHHSLHPPLDKSQVYWNFGGSTVVTRKLIRLTPDTQDRKGWLWNEYPIESENWEFEVNFEVYSNPHFGGDGFAFWILSGDQDPTFSTEPDVLNGPIMGMKEDFAGVGVIFDVYDNDNKRNNPSIFVLENMAGEDTQFNHDNDFEDNMVKSTPDVVPGHVGEDSTAYRAHKCVADFRNTGKGSKFLVKFLHKVLHVYVDAQEGKGYKFCLAVELPDVSFVDYHIAFTAATGQVADTHDIKSITGRYLADSDEDFDDSLMDHYGASRKSGGNTWSAMFQSLCVLGFTSLMAYTGYQMFLLRRLAGGARIDLVRVCKQLNETTIPLWSTHAAFTVLLLCLFQWIPLLLNLPILGFRLYQIGTNQIRFTETSLSGQATKGHEADDLSALSRLIVNLVLYSIPGIFILCRYFFGI